MTREMIVYERLYHDNGAHYRLQYILLTDEIHFGLNTLDIYGVKIAQYKDGDFVLQRSIRGITPFSTKIMSLLNRLSDGLTPPEAMERMIGEEVGVGK